MRALVALAFALVCAAAFPAAARDITTDEGAALDRTIADFITATRAADGEGILAVMPPAIFNRIAVENSLTVEQLRTAMLTQIAALAEDMAGSEFVMDTATAEHRELADGTPYLVVPTTTILDMGTGKKTTAYTPTLAFMEEGTWYLVRVADDAQVRMLTTAYPQFTGVAFPAARTESTTP